MIVDHDESVASAAWLLVLARNSDCRAREVLKSSFLGENLLKDRILAKRNSVCLRESVVLS